MVSPEPSHRYTKVSPHKLKPQQLLKRFLKWSGLKLVLSKLVTKYRRVFRLVVSFFVSLKQME